jgi:Spy/CpxP family protein refolding chaperone
MSRLEKKSLRTKIYALLFTTLLSSLVVAEQSNEDAASALGNRSTYFTAKVENLTQKLNLSSEQQAKIKPIVEQEVGYLGEVHNNPVLSKQEKLKKLEGIVRNSDAEMKPLLSEEQWQKLQTLRKQQKQELKKLAENKTSAD